jgi:hypothetical protein
MLSLIEDVAEDRIDFHGGDEIWVGGGDAKEKAVFSGLHVTGVKMVVALTYRGFPY